MPLFDLDDENEEWRPVVGFEGYYEVSSLGRLRSAITKRIRKAQGSRYLSISLSKNGEEYNRLIHRLVAESFIPNPDNLPEVNHKDLNTMNCKVSNLEWATVSYNNMHKNLHRDKHRPYRMQVKCLETGVIYDSISAAGRSVQADATQVVESIAGQRCCKGMTFVYMSDLPNDPETYMKEAHAKYQTFHKRPNMQNSRKVKEIETGRIFDSIAAAARYYNCDTATINNRIEAKKAFNGVTLEFVEQ